jgi:hypothetical protein
MEVNLPIRQPRLDATNSFFFGLPSSQVLSLIIFCSHIQNPFNPETIYCCNEAQLFYVVVQ